MKFFKFIKHNKIESCFMLLVLIFGFLYFVVYMTHSREMWYDEMFRQVNVVLTEVMKIGGLE